VIRYLLGSAVVIFLVLVVVGGLTGRVRAQNCCSIADPDKDLRMRIPEVSAPEAETHDPAVLRTTRVTDQ
jgi:hypothetical protein